MTATSTARLDMSLDELIKRNKSLRRGRGPGGRGMRDRGYAPRAYRRPDSFRNRRGSGVYRPFHGPPSVPSKFSARQASEGVWEHDMFDKVTGILPPYSRPLAIETGTKLYISNLDYGVSTDDIKELFSEVGDLKRCSIHYDPSGRSKGTAEVVYSRKKDGIAALKRYNNVQLDGKFMKIEFIGSNLAAPAVPSATTTMAAGQSGSTLRATNGGSNRFYEGQAPNYRTFGMGRRFFGGRWGYRGRGRGRGGRGRGRGQGLGRLFAVATKSAADLDADLETYHSDAMQM